MKNTFSYKAPAKINLTLEVLRRLPSGYHALRSVVLKLPDLHDILTFNIDPGGNGILVRSNHPEIPSDESNLSFQAAKTFLEKTKKNIGVEIVIEKNIPLSAGLGGGSTDAAATFIALNNYFGKPLSNDKLIKLASFLGKDIPLFFSERRALLMEGMGEKLSNPLNFPNLTLLLVNPLIKISTPWAYQELSAALWFMKSQKRANFSHELLKAITKKETKSIAHHLYNDFELPIEKHFPIIKELKQVLLAFGAKGALMSGSGSTVFGIFETKEAAKTASLSIKKHYPTFFTKVC